RRRASPEAEHPITKRPPRASLPATWARDVVEAVGRPVLTTTAVALLIYLGWQAFRWGGPANQQLIGDLAFIPFNLGAIVAAVLASRAHRHDRATRWAWGLLAAAFTGYLLATCVQIYYELVAHRPLPFPSWADVGYLITYPLVLIGLLRFPVPRRSRDERLTLVLDIAIVAVGGYAVIWFVDIAPMTAVRGGHLSQVTSLAYPVGDLVLMFGAVSLLLRDPRLRAAWPLRLLLLGFGMYLVTDLWYTHLQLLGSYQGGDLVDTGWIIALALVMLAAVAHVRRPTRAAPEPALSPPDVGRRRSRLPDAAAVISYAFL